MIDTVTGVVIAGGKSRRFGKPKAFAKREGKYFYQWSEEALAPVVDSMILVTSNELEAEFRSISDLTIVTDVFTGKGPLAALYTAMLEKEATWYAAIPIDVPFMKHEVYEKLFKERADGIQIIIPIVNRRLQPLIGFYHVSLKKIIQTLLESDQLSMQDLIEKANVKIISFTEEQPFININRLEDYETLIDRDRGI